MKIELLKRGDNNYLVRYKYRWLWRYVGHDHDWFWPTYGSVMDEESARETIKDMVEKEKFDRSEDEIVESITI